MNTMSRQVRRQIERNGELRTPGFTPVASQKLSHRVSTKLLDLAYQLRRKSAVQLAVLGLPTNMAEAKEEAERRVVRELPAPRMVRSTKIKPSKSDDFFYRNPHLRNA